MPGSVGRITPSNVAARHCVAYPFRVDCFAAVPSLAAMPVVLAMLLTAAGPAAASPAGPRNEIVVRGTSLRALEDDLKRCIAGHCPVRQDVIASVRYAEGLFRSARYLDARRVLQGAIARDRAGGRADPYAVAALYEATATVARHEGDQAVVAEAVGGRVGLLRETLGRNSPDLLRAETDWADIVFVRSSPTRAIGLYRGIATRAEAAGQPGIAAGAQLRVAQGFQALGDAASAARVLDGIVARGEAVPPGYRLAALALKARLPHRHGDSSAMEALQAALARTPQPVPILLAAPPQPRPGDPVNLDYFNRTDTVTRATDLGTLRWADIGFSVRPDGTVEMPERLRGSLDGSDVTEIEKAIGRRIYAAFPAAGGARYRIERWTLTADYGTPTGSLIRRRGNHPRYETLDITAGPPPRLAS